MEGTKTEPIRPETKAPKNGGQPALLPLRTFENDLSEILRQKELSAARIRLAEQKRIEQKIKVERLEQETKQVQRESRRKFFVLFLSLVLLVTGGWLGFRSIVSFRANRPLKTETAPPAPTLVRVDFSQQLDVSQKSGAEIVAALAEAAQNYDLDSSARLVQLYLFKRDGLGRKSAITAEEFLSLTTPLAPSSLVRSLGPLFTWGFWLDGAERQPFLILEVQSFENSFAGMLEWEKTAARDFGFLFGRTYPAGAFVDRLLRNRDLRGLSGPNDSRFLFYSFLNQRAVLIADSQEVFREILNRFLVAGLSR